MWEEREKDGVKREKMGPFVSFINPSCDFGNSVTDNWEIDITKRSDKVILMAPYVQDFWIPRKCVHAYSDISQKWGVLLTN